MSQVAYVFYGRMNPFTIGHKHAANTMIAAAHRNGAKPFIIMSHTQKRNKNPLSASQKMNFMKLYKFPTNVVIRTSNTTHPSIFQIKNKMMKNNKFKNVVLFVGTDNENALKSKKPAKLKFSNSFTTVPIKRPVGAPSGTAARTAAFKNFSSFRKFIPSNLSNANVEKLRKLILNQMNKPKSK